jgi:hypothetical protein
MKAIETFFLISAIKNSKSFELSIAKDDTGKEKKYINFHWNHFEKGFPF